MRREARIAACALAILAAAGCAAPGKAAKGRGPEGISFLVVPADAEVLLDGVVQGKAGDYPDERPLRAPAGSRRLELRAPGYETHVRRIEVTPLPKRIEATLLRKEPAPAGGANGNGTPNGTPNGAANGAANGGANGAGRDRR